LSLEEKTQKTKWKGLTRLLISIRLIWTLRSSISKFRRLIIIFLHMKPKSWSGSRLGNTLKRSLRISFKRSSSSKEIRRLFSRRKRKKKKKISKSKCYRSSLKKWWIKCCKNKRKKSIRWSWRTTCQKNDLNYIILFI